MTLSSTQFIDVTGDPWGLDRIDQRSASLDREYEYLYANRGTGVRAYIIDSGLQSNHPEFGGRAMNVHDTTDAEGTEDCNGHGTHVARTVGSKTYGVAKSVQLRGVRIFGCATTGFASDAIAGVDWVTKNHIKPAVANISSGVGRAMSSYDTAVKNLVAAGVFVAVSAGNASRNACDVSPAREPSVFTTAASTKDDHRAGFSNWGSNWGSCVDAYAPGVDIKSTYLNGATASKSGTSMASPHVAGVAALICSEDPDDCRPSSITDWIEDEATEDEIDGNYSSTPNRLLYKRDL